MGIRHNAIDSKSKANKMKQCFIEPIQYDRKSKRDDMIPVWRSQILNGDSPYRTVPVPYRTVLTIMVPYIIIPDKSEKDKHVDKEKDKDRDKDRDGDIERETYGEGEAHTTEEREIVCV